VLEHPWLNKSIGTAQRRVEQQNFSIRKRTLEYDDVMNKQREVIYGLRSEIVASENVREKLLEIVEDVITQRVDDLGELKGEPEELKDFLMWVNMTFPVGVRPADVEPVKTDSRGLADLIIDRIKTTYAQKAGHEDSKALASMERFLILQAVDMHWQEYLRGMDALRQGVGLRAYGQRDPLVEYKREAFDMFEDLLNKIKGDVVHRMFRAATSQRAMDSFIRTLPAMYVHQGASAMAQASAASQSAQTPAHAAPPPGADQAMQAAMANALAPVIRDEPKVGRNDPCPCGSGKKYKKCCGSEG